MPDAAGTTCRPCGPVTIVSSSEHSPLSDVAQMESGMQSEDHVDVGHAQVGIDQHDVAPLRRD